MIINLPSIINVFGLMSWHGVVTVSMLRGSFPCNHKAQSVVLVRSNAFWTKNKV